MVQGNRASFALVVALVLPTLAVAVSNGDFSGGLAGWLTESVGGLRFAPEVIVDDGALVLREGDGFLAIAEQTISLPGGQGIGFTYTLDAGFDDIEVGFSDTLEVHLLNANGLSLLPPWREGASAFLSVQQDGQVFHGPAVTVDNGTVRVDLTGVDQGDATLRFVLVGADAGRTSEVRIDDVEFVPLNREPIAVAGDDFAAECDTTFELDATASSDPDADSLTFRWRNGATVLGSDAMLTVGPYPLGSETFTVEVTDAKGLTAVDDVTVTIADISPPTVTGPPTAEADEDGSCAGSLPDLTALVDAADCTEVTLSQSPAAGTAVDLATPVTVTVTATDAGGHAADHELEFTLVDSDGTCLPVANPGPPVTLTCGEGVVLDGSASTDPNGQALDYTWTHEGDVVSSDPTLELEDLLSGEHVYTLTVTNPSGDFGEADVTVTVTDPLGGITCDGVCGPDEPLTSIDCDACAPDADSDGDGVCDASDTCPGGIDAHDADGNGIPDACDPCGDGVLDAGEDCDDGNVVPYDGCSAGCVLEEDSDGDGYTDPFEDVYGDPGEPTDFACVGGRNPQDPVDIDEADWVIYGERRFDHLGHDVTNAGDMNGDGHDDLVVAAWGSDEAGRGSGSAWLFYGPFENPNATLDDADVIFRGVSPGLLGRTVQGVGDVDGDGRDDLVVAGWQPQSVGFGSRAVLVLGRGNFPLVVDLGADADAVFTGLPNDGLGHAVAGGDFDGDGLADIALGAPRDDTTGVDAGAIYVFTGLPVGEVDVSTADVVLHGTEARGTAGSSLAFLGDIDGDGRDDLAIGAPEDDRLGNKSGRVHVVHGGPLTGNHTLDDAAALVFHGADTDRLGTAVSPAGDLNGDGYDDFWLGAAFWGGQRRGAVFLVNGGEMDGLLGIHAYHDVMITGRNGSDRFGDNIAGPVDVNADGAPDVVISAWRSDSTSRAGTGAAWVAFGPFEDDQRMGDDARRQGISPVGEAGRSLAVFADGDGDGFGDLVLGSPRSTTVGPRRSGMVSFFRGGVTTNHGATWYADRDGDGFGDDDITIIACDPPAGFVAVGGDCNDDPLQGGAAYRPYAAETDCSLLIDFNCDGTVGAFDLDGDGVRACDGDCDDSDGDVFAGAVEVCGDEADNDCNGSVDGGDAVDAVDWYGDGDGDGYGGFHVSACERPPFLLNVSFVGGDCNDTDPLVHPDAAEVCGDGIDNDCEDGVDDGGAVDAVVYYADLDGDGYGDVLDTQSACFPPFGYVDNGRDCDDGDGTVSPDAAETCDERDEDCSGAEFREGTVEPDMTLVSHRPDDLGAAVALLPDTNGDGFAELVMSGPEADINSSAAGAVYVRYGRPHGGVYDVHADLSGDLQHYEARVLGVQADGNLGAAVATGDLNGDGVGDLVVGVPASNTARAGQVVVLLGPVTGDYIAATAHAVLSVGIPRDRFGGTLAIGDHDGDGLDDLLVGATGSANEAGHAWLYYGRADWSAAVPDAQLAAATAGNQSGSAVAFLGDVDGDGAGDLAVGAFTAGSVDQGAVAIYRGNGGRFAGVLGAADITVAGVEGSERLGIAVAGPGDTNGDGLADLVVGGRKGRVYLLYGQPGGWTSGPISASTDVVITGRFGSLLGRRLAAAGDIDGDGLDDWLLGAPTERLNGFDAGAAYIVYGRADLPATLSATELESVREPPIGAALFGGLRHELGQALASGADVNGDGHLDVVVGAPGAREVHVLFAGADGIDDGPPPEAPWWLPDLDGDGLPDTTMFGAAFQACPASIPLSYDATPLAVSLTCDSADTGCPR